MPRIKSKETYYCDYCDKPHKTMADAYECEDSHELIYVPLSAADLAALNNFLVTGNPDYITHSLTNTIRKYRRIGG